MPEAIEPMLATLGKLPQDSEKWAFEFKWDGIRAISYWNGRQLSIKSRNLIDITFRYPELYDIGPLLGASAIIDGEIVALDEKNSPSFAILQKRMNISSPGALKSLAAMRIYYYVFDILFQDGKSLMQQPYTRRRRSLEKLNISHRCLKVSPSYLGKGQAILAVAKQHHLEGIVCKKVDSLYTPGIRSNEWIKVKLVKSGEFIICGFRYSGESVSRIGSLQLGAYDDDMKLHFVGSLGTGFSDDDHRFLLDLLTPIKIKKPAFVEKPEKNVVFTKPVYVAQVEYRRWPAGGMLQQSSYKGIRTDKSASEIRMRET
jgi:bifunctional non-homologous end joining protein LigD